jgi:hypothetical protein
MRFGLSPVFIYECLANSRRWQTYAIPSIGVALLLVAVASIAMSHATIDPTRAWRDYGETCRSSDKPPRTSRPMRRRTGARVIN